MDNSDIFFQITKLVIEHRWDFKRELTRADRLSEDLGMAGDDAEDFLKTTGINLRLICQICASKNILLTRESIPSLF